MVVLLSVFAEPILRLFYGNKYLAAAPAMEIFAVGVGFLTVFYVLAFALNGAGLVRVPMKLSLLGLVFFVPLNLVFIPNYGIVGASTAMALVSFVLFVGILLATKKHFSVTLPLITLRNVILAIAPVAAIGFLLPDGPLSFMLSGALLFVLYLVLLWFLGELKNEDIAPLRKMFSRTPQNKNTTE
jgi:O-antigen/teichoic acid export membrane protein